jgi:dephospho-CoA kinase
MKWIGLTGSIATGKSTVKKLIESRGFPVIDADFISHELTQIGAAGYKQVVAQFGSTILNLDQSLNRRALGSIIFSDLQKKELLENILHPLIKKEVHQLKQSYQKNNCAICFYDVPLLFEKNLKPDFDQVILVWCDAETQRKRLQLRNSISEAEAVSRMNSQIRMSLKIKNSDHCLDNSTDLVNLQRQVGQLLGRLV